ncbi:MAG: ABC transporter permease [Saprospiraceae bacterium]|nr:ABC transporter permease [Saprospiraceae bacterium]
MLKNYLKIAWKVLGRNKFFTFVSLFGISFTLAVLLIIATMLEDLLNPKYPELKGRRTLVVNEVTMRDEDRTSMSRSGASFHFLDHYVKKLKTPELVAINSNGNSATAFVGDKKLALDLRYTCENYWKVFDFEFMEGKPFGKNELDNNAYVAVISENTRDQYFGLGEEALGKTIVLNGVSFRVMGVVKNVPFFRGATAADLYLPYSAVPWDFRRAGYLGGFEANILAYSRSDFPALKAEFDNMVSRIDIPEEDYLQILEVEAKTLLEHIASEMTASDVNPVGMFLGVLIGGMFLFMLLPAVNLINLNTSRIMERASEIGVRKAFGATAQSLTVQFLVENILLTLLGGVIGLVLASIVIQVLNGSGWIPNAQFSVNYIVFLAGLSFCLIFGLLSGVLPARRMSKLKIVNAIKGGES